jgi:hypothetical protein
MMFDIPTRARRPVPKSQSAARIGIGDGMVTVVVSGTSMWSEKVGGGAVRGK